MFSGSSNQPSPPQDDPTWDAAWDAFELAVLKMSGPSFEGSDRDSSSPWNEVDENSSPIPLKQEEDLDETKPAAVDNTNLLSKTRYDPSFEGSDRDSYSPRNEVGENASRIPLKQEEDLDETKPATVDNINLLSKKTSNPSCEGRDRLPYSPQNEVDENASRIPFEQEEDLDQTKPAAMDNPNLLCKTPYESYRSVCDSGHVRLMRQRFSPDNDGSPTESIHQPEPQFPPPVRHHFYPSDFICFDTPHPGRAGRTHFFSEASSQPLQQQPQDHPLWHRSHIPNQGVLPPRDATSYGRNDPSNLAGQRLRSPHQRSHSLAQPNRLQHQARGEQPERLSNFALAPEERVPSQRELADAAYRGGLQNLNRWYVRFNELVEYRETFGNCNVPNRYKPNPPLGFWVDRQRAKKNSLSDAKVEKLGKIGFRWAKPRFKTKWEWKYRELCQYYRQHGHSDVRTKCPGNPALGRWASKQRAEYKKFLGGGETCITREQVEKLNLVDFQWSAKPRYYRAPVPETGDAPKENGPSRAL